MVRSENRKKNAGLQSKKIHQTKSVLTTQNVTIRLERDHIISSFLSGM